MANVRPSINHDFCSGVVDYPRRRLWVFCSAFGRRNQLHPGPCRPNIAKGCYVGAWHASLDNLTVWSPVSKAVRLPDGATLYNNDVTLVPYGRSTSGLPPHQAAMVLESHQFQFAVNTGRDGDLTRNWHLLNSSEFSLSDQGAAGEGTGDAPALKYDAEQGYYYSFGGGWITNGPARSRNLRVGTWTVSPYAPIAIPAARAKRVGLPAKDQRAGLNTDMYTSGWAGGVPPVAQAFVENMSSWNFGVTDPDSCCDDGLAPSFMLHTLSQQGAPANFTGQASNFAVLLQSNLTQYAWLRSYFP